MPPDKKKTPVGAIAALFAICLLVLIFTIFFEIVPQPPQDQYSARAKNNKFLALQRWLKAEEREVLERRYPKPVKIAATPSDTLIVDAESLDEDGALLELLLNLTRDGNHVLLHSIDIPNLAAPNSTLLRDTGLRFTQYPEEKQPRSTAHEQIGPNYHSDEDTPLFDKNSGYFGVAKGTIAERIWIDEIGAPRICEISLGDGRLILCGVPYFMFNRNIEQPANAALSWNVSSNGTKILFIQGASSEPALFGALFDKGNLSFFLTALTLLIFCGFWMTLAPFGRALPETPNQNTNTEARWQYEGRFLKKYKALDALIAPWRQRFIRRLGYRATDKNTFILTEEEAVKLAERASITSAEILDLFNGTPTHNMRQFRQRMHTIHALRETL